MRRTSKILAFGLASTLVAACSSAGAAPVPSGTAASGASGGAVTSIEALKGAIIQIEGQGTFRDPANGEESASWRGSGFIVDPSGIAITNNHVVTGAGALTVWVGGDKSTPHHARVLGASECSDIAVIKIDGGPYPYAKWYSGAIDTGVDIYVAGFPLGDPEYTLTRGIVSKAKGSVDADWSDVEHAIEHDANTNPGNSGGPVVTKDAQVVAVHYAGNADTQQHWAISRDEVQPILPDLEAGRDETAIGINGKAVKTDSIAGIWVSSVKAGSEASKAGIEPGDVITKLNGVALAQEGTMREYCEVLRSNDPTAALSLEVVRLDTKEVLKGEINGKELKQSFSFAQQEGDGAAGDTSGSGSGAADYASYTKVTSKSGAMSVEVPSEWTDTNVTGWTYRDENVGESITASPSIDGFTNGYDTPGVFIGYSKKLATASPADMLDNWQFANDCTLSGERKSFENDQVVGAYEVWEKCGGGTTKLLVVAAGPPDGSAFVLVQIQAVDEKDLAALDHIVSTLNLQ